MRMLLSAVIFLKMIMLFRNIVLSQEIIEENNNNNNNGTNIQITETSYDNNTITETLDGNNVPTIISKDTNNVRTIQANMMNIYSFRIMNKQTHIFVYKYKIDLTKNISDNISMHILRIVCTADYSNMLQEDIERENKCPLWVKVWQGDSAIIWKVSSVSDRIIRNNTAGKGIRRSIIERLMCIDPTQFTVNVELFTCSDEPIRYSVSVHLRDDLYIQRNIYTRTQITPTAPAVYFFPFDPDEPDFAFIQVSASSTSCMIMSIQKPTCPVSDDVEKAKVHGQYQSLTLQTGMTIERSEYPFGFFIVFILLPNDSQCRQLYGVAQPLPNITSSEPRTKTIEFTVRDTLSPDKYLLAIFLPLSIYIASLSTIILIYCYFHHVRSMITDGPSSISQQTIESQGNTKSKVRSGLRVAELIIGKPERLLQQSKRYYVAGLLVASFYSVPVFQLIFSFHQQLQETGNFDLCYFNYLCSHKFGNFHDFNHLYSNIGYIICGFGFIIIVYIRQRSLIMISEDDLKLTRSRSSAISRCFFWFSQVPYDINKGVFVHHGLFYAMGFSVCMTGVMSTVYHICPNQSNFQFDTAFMYTTAALGVVTIYQLRHPTYVSASLTFMTLAIVAAATVIGLLWENMKFRLFFTVTHLIFLLLILVYIHYVGYIRTDGITVTEWSSMCAILWEKWQDDAKKCRLFGFQTEIWSSSRYPTTVVLPGPCRPVFPFCVVLVNTIAMLIIWKYMPNSNFASQVLTVYVINCSVYKFYYVMMKILHRECRGRLWRQPAIYLALSISLWGLALSFFGNSVTLWERSPAESRERNAPCILIDFYDSHDVWHLSSAAAMFFSLMALLTIDDDLLNRQKSQIPVF